MKRAAGLTLLEILLALSILVVITTLAASWLVHAGRVGQIARARAQGIVAWEATVALLRDDISAAPLATDASMKANSELRGVPTLTLATFHQAAGDAPGSKRVSYRYDAEHHELWRTPEVIGEKAPHQRLVTTRLCDVIFIRDDTGGLHLRARVVGNADAAESSTLQADLGGGT
ncbi:MAG: hypothetical protein H0W83_04645 [Planctomycetes bacterium]|nr:hypothetical protein [Planctomycetota bacterium]